MATGDRHRNHEGRVARFDAARGGNLSLETRIGQRIVVTPGGCWAFNGVLNEYGFMDGKAVHRVTYEALNGEIPEGWHVHHRCKNRGCANPAHLKAMPASAHQKAHGKERLPVHLAAKLRGIAS